jgi:NDP-sugar pyrophosphorylase family protein
MKERVTLTIEKDLLMQVDSTVNNVDIKNRSHAVEMLITKALGSNRPSHAVILAGGQKSSTEKLPRSMIRLQNKPLLQHNIELLKKYGITDITLCIGEKGGELIKDYFSDGDEFGVKINYIEEKEPLGTAGPLFRMRRKADSPFILLNSDELKDIDLEDMFAFHKRNKGMATIALTTMDDPTKYGVAIMNGHRIVAFVEKPGKEGSSSKLINAGLYILEPEVIKMVPEGFAMMEQDILPRLAREDKLIGYVFSGQWFDTSSQQKITEAESSWRGIR